MALTEKYASLIEMAQANGNVTVVENGDVLNISGTVNDEAAKEALWAEYNRLDPDMRSGDLVMDVAVGAGGGQTYTVKSGDSLSKIANHYPGVTWHQIFEANRDQISDPDMIHPGQVLKIPSAG